MPSNAGRHLLENYKKRCVARKVKQQEGYVWSITGINFIFITDIVEDKMKSFDCGDSAYATMIYCTVVLFLNLR